MKSKVSAGALRAAKLIRIDCMRPGTGFDVLDYAEIIDKQTGLPEILEALEESQLTLVNAVRGSSRHKLWLKINALLAEQKAQP